VHGINEMIQAKLLSPYQVFFGYSLDELLLLKKYQRGPSSSRKGFHTDYFGIKTRYSYFSTPTRNMDDQELVIGLPFPGDKLHAEALEYLAAAKAVDLARDQFVSVELGAAWGPWISLTGTMARKMGFRNITLVGVEANRELLGFMRCHFGDNGLPVPDDSGTATNNGIRVEIIHGAISDRSGSGSFAAASWGGRIIDPATDHRETPKWKIGAIKYLKRLTNIGINHGNTVSGGDPYTVPFYCIEDIIAKYPIVDYVHVDIQGEELKAIARSIDCMNARVRLMHIGTHSRIIEAGLLNLLLSNKWVLLNEKPCRFRFPLDPDADVVTRTVVDGSQVWVNPRLEKNLPDYIEQGRLYAQLHGDAAAAKAFVDLLAQSEAGGGPQPLWCVNMNCPFVIPRHWQGFSLPESWGTWTVGPQAKLCFGLSVAPQSDVEFCIKGHALVTARHNQRLTIEVNGQVMDSMILSAESPAPMPIRIPRAVLESDDVVEVVIGTPDAVSPKALGINEDERVLGIAIESINVQAVQGSDRSQ